MTEPFDPLGPLPTGTTVLAASAGTGKTWTIATLATRYVAEGVVQLSELLLVTFNRSATRELRERTRARMLAVASALSDPESGDPLVGHLAALGADACRRRLLRALSDYDAATIATTHSFCQQALAGLGFAGDRDPTSEHVEDLDQLVSEVAADAYLQRYAATEFLGARITAKQGREATKAAVADREARLEPMGAAPQSESGQRVAIARASRQLMGERKARRGQRDYDDLIHLLRDVLADPEHGAAASARLRAPFRVVLADEFQDTDPAQWEVLRRAFHGHATLILIGDPKQAIYAFRGAEVLSYLDAVSVAGTHQTLTTNHRSDPRLLAALEHVYLGAELGDPQIVVETVQAPPGPGRLTEEGGGRQTPVRVRQVLRMPPFGQTGLPVVGPLRRRVAEDVAADVVQLLTGPTRFDGRRVEPGDIAVLVRKTSQAELVRGALERAGVPCVLAGSASVFGTPAGRDWLRLLEAVATPHRLSLVRAAALTPLIGWTAARLAGSGESELSELSAQLRDWSRLLDEAGFAALFERLARGTRLEVRLLETLSGERLLTDLRHVAALLNRAAVEQGLGLTALIAWLTDRLLDTSGVGSGERSRRLESDAAAVQILTVHGSKGLEFPVVYLPFAWDGASAKPTSLLFHDADGERVRDLGGSQDAGYAGRRLRHDQEEAGDELRLLYVALTRAQSQVVLWWAPSWNTDTSPLHRLLLGRQGAAVAGKAPVLPDQEMTERLASWALAADGLISLETVTDPALRRWQPEGHARPDLAVARFRRPLDQAWRRTSYSGLTAAAHDAAHLAVPGVSSEAEEPEKTDEPELDVAVDPEPGVPSLFNGFAGGASFGTLVHEVLEELDTGASDLAAELVERCRRAVARRFAQVDPVELAAALLPVLRTPLVPGVALRDVRPADRLPELDFELPLAGGDIPTGTHVSLRQVAALLREHLDPTDPLAPYPDLLERLDDTHLRGFLSGSIDAVLRLPGPRYVVVDYKTNRLGRGDLTVEHYRRSAMAEEMLRAHYPLQALLYAVALHRFLRWRQPAYDPAAHLGGVLYLFVRGMVGEQTPAGCGVFDWHPPADLVVALSDLLAGA
jgi:exodeoxyribonuclease V beta subunit